MRYWPKVSIYHSHLSKYTSEHGGIPCRLVSDVMPSKNKDGSKIVRLNPYQDETEYWLALENPTCAAIAQALPKNEWFTLQAHGARDTATLTAIDTDGNDITPEVGMDAPQDPFGAQEPHAAPPSWPPVQRGLGNQTAPEPHVFKPMPVPPPQELMLSCLMDAAELCEQFEAHHGRPPTEEERSIAISLFIERQRKGGY